LTGWSISPFFPKNAVTIGGSWGMDYGAAIWKTKTLVLPSVYILNPNLSYITFGLIYDFLTE
jgi:hypothetical protein